MIRALGHDRIVAIALVLLIIGLVLPKLIYPVVGIDLLCFALFAVSFDLLFGYVGLLSFGQALFWGGGGYVASIVIARTHADVAVAITAGVAYALIAAALVGMLAVRRAGIYFAMVTLAVAQIQYFLAVQFVDVTGGDNGLNLGARGRLLGISVENDLVYYYITFAVVVIAVWFALRVTRSPFGGVLQAMRENEPRAIALGYRVDRYKIAVFTMSGGLAGFAGALYAVGNHLAGLEMVDWHTSGAVVMMTVLGGIGTVVGPIVGAALFQLLEYFVSKTPIGEETNLVMGVIFALCILLFRRGIVGSFLAPRTRRAKT